MGDVEIPTELRGPLRFGDRNQIAALRGYEFALAQVEEYEAECREWYVEVPAALTITVAVQAIDAIDAEAAVADGEGYEVDRDEEIDWEMGRATGST